MIPIDSVASLWDTSTTFDVLKGKTIVSIEGMRVGSTQIQFNCSDGYSYIMGHAFTIVQPVEVQIDDICGEVNDLIGSPIIVAEENYNEDGEPKSASDQSWLWVFYKLATIKGYVDIKWYGVSDGRYSEAVEMYKVKNETS